jgi:hypothetical protein
MATSHEDVQNAFNYYNALGKKEKELVEHYKAEMDPDDWVDKPLKISYTVMNWALKSKKSPLAYTPDLISSGAVTPAQLHDQVKNAEALSDVLETFPRIKAHAGVTVYRGKTCANIATVPLGKEVTMHNFLSTSTDVTVASRFTERGDHPCLMRIHLPKGNPLPFVAGAEQEVLLPPGSTFTLREKSHETINGRRYEVYDFTLLRLGSIKTRHYWRGGTPPATQALTPRRKRGDTPLTPQRKKTRRRDRRRDRRRTKRRNTRGETPRRKKTRRRD